ncbi:Ig-like domain-containing protein [Vogesella sp. AC12]|uniref:Ig-like domain-containing protein n=1 Tax=Vogesella sp. AC12 TaxID=2950550 RepID=UPI00210BF455|nr:Ig-like domain-containing protein [Vogesella sp. AC12]MCQ4143513.1 Ig-like domain-containing protein [Vogesella sp. AC12]
MTLTSSGGIATLAQWQAALRAVTYTDSAITPNTATRTVSVSVSDGSKDSATVTRTVTVAATDQTPIATTTGSAGAYVVGGGATAVDSGLTVSDLDSVTLASATVAITGNFHSGEDVLAFSNTSAITYGNIAASYNAGTGVLTLTSSGGTATLAQWQAALRAVTYNDTAGTPSTVTRTISFSISDGSKSSAVMSRSIEMQLPVPSITGLTVGSDTGSSSSDGITSNVHPTVTGTAVANSTVSIYVDNVLIDTTTADGSGAWSYSLVSSLSSGTHSITALTTIGGASSAQSMSYSIMVDSSAPAAPAGLALSTATDSGSSSSDGITSQTMPTVTGTAEANSTVEVYVDGVPVGSVTTDGSGAWSYTLGRALSSGSHSLSAIATDAAGNSSSQSTTYSITVDSSAPTVLAMSLLDDSPTSNSVRYLVSFSEDVEGLDSIDFSLSGSARGSIGGVQQLNARTYIVLVNNVAGSGALQLNLAAGSVGDAAGNTLAATYNGASYNVIPLAVVVAEPAPEAVVSTPADADVMPVTPNIVLAATGLGGALAPIDTLLPSALLTEAIQPLLGTSGMPISAVMVNAMQVLAIEVRLPLLIQPLPVGENFSFSLPPGTFSLKHGDGVVMVARQTNGQPLPSWMRFDPASGRFSGLMPAGNRQPVEVVVMVRDSQGNQAETRLRLEAARAALEQATAEAPDQGSVASDGQSAVLQEDGQTILPGKLALAEQLARQGNKHFGSAVNALLGAADKVVTRG